jgi:serine/threonine protein kinase
MNTKTNTNTIRIPARRRSAVYQAPELATPGGTIGRSSDVWSFGCILFQVLARGVGPGRAEIERLNRLRTLEPDLITEHPTDYFYREKNGAKYLNPHVKDWLKPTGAVESYLVKDCKGLILEMLNISPNLRPKSRRVNEKLSTIAHGSGTNVRHVSNPDSIPEERDTAQLSGERQANSSLPSISVSGPAAHATEGGSGGTSQDISHREPRPIVPPTRARPPPGTVPTARNLNAAINLAHRTSEHPPTQDLLSRPVPKSTLPRKPLNSEARRTAAGSSSVDGRSIPQAQSSSSPDNSQVAQPTRRTPATPVVPQLPATRAPPMVTPYQGNPSRRSSSLSGGVSRASTQSSSSSGSHGLSPITSVDSAVFTEVKDVLVALLSPLSAKQAFITPTKIYIRTMSSPWSHCTITMKDHKWDSGSIAGNYLCVIGKDVVQKSRVRNPKIHPEESALTKTENFTFGAVYDKWCLRQSSSNT